MTLIHYRDLVPVVDSDAIRCAKSMEELGSLNVQVCSHNGYRIIRSLDPSGPNGEFEFHVSVSKNSQPVTFEIALMYAKVIFPAGQNWQCEMAGTSHCRATIPQKVSK